MAQIRKLKKTSSIYSLGLFISCHFSIQTVAANTTEDAYLEEFPVILSASRLEQPILEAPGSVTIIDRDLIELSGARQIPELLRYVPGMQLGHATDNTAVATYHGLSDRYSRRMQVLIDGRSVYTPSFGGVFWENLPITVDDIEKIEVIRGANSALYGSNSFSAVISITTRFAAGTVQRGLRATVEDKNNNSVKANWSAGHEKFEYAVSSFYFVDEGDTNEESDREADADRRRAINLSFDVQISELDNLHISAGALDGTGKTGNGEVENIFRDVERDYDYIRIKHDHQFNSGDRIYWQLSNTNERSAEEKFGYRVPLPGLPANVFFDAKENTRYESRRQELEVIYTGELSDKLRYVAGGSIRNDMVKSATLLQGDESIDVERIFLNTQTYLSSSTLLGLGAMHEYNEYSGSSVSPKLSIVQKIGSNHSLRLVASKSTRSPVAFEENAHFTPIKLTASAALSGLAGSATPIKLDPIGLSSSSNLENEEQTSYELGYKLVFNTSRPSSLDLRIFYDELSNLINNYKRVDSLDLYTADKQAFVQALTVDPTGDVYEVLRNTPDFRNFINMTIKGIELDIDFQLNEKLRILASAAYIKMHNTNTQGEVQSIVNSGIIASNIASDIEDTQTTAPEYSGNLSLIYRPTQAVGINISYHYSSNSSWLGDGKPNNGTQQILNVYTQYKHSLGRKQTLLTGLGVQNIADDNYVDFHRRNPSELSAYLTLGLDF